MRYTNVLVAYDESEPSLDALKAAIDLIADSPSSKLSVLKVAEMPEFDTQAFVMAAKRAGIESASEADVARMKDEYLADESASLIEAVTPYLEGVANPVVTEAIAGKPSRAILQYATDHGCDFIVMGCRGMNALMGVVGSVSYAVLRAAEIPVLIVK